MARQKKIDWREQVYDVGNDVTVTVRYRADARPRMTHNDTFVTVGESPEEASIVRALTAAPAAKVAESNGPQHDTPEIIAQKKILGLPFGAKTADLFGGEDVGDALIAGVESGQIPVITGETDA